MTPFEGDLKRDILGFPTVDVMPYTSTFMAE